MSLDPVIDASGYPRPAVTIKVEGDEWDENILKEPIKKQPGTFTKEEILAAISAAESSVWVAPPSRSSKTIPPSRKYRRSTDHKRCGM